MSATLFVRNLPFDVTQDALEQVFGEIGPVKKVDVIKDKGKRKSESTTRGFAFVRYAMEADANYALEKLNQTEFRGRRMVMEIAKEKGKKKQESRQQVKLPVDSVSAPTTSGTVMDDHPHLHGESAGVSEEPDARDSEKADKKKAKKEKKSKEKKLAEREPEQQEAQEEVTRKEEKKDKKEKKEKKRKEKAKLVEAEEEAVAAPEHEEVQKNDKKDKKEKKEKKSKKEAKVVEEPEPAAVVQPLAKKAVPAQLSAAAVANATRDAANRVQSERNARRRMHREFLRQVEVRKETNATAEEKSILIYGIGPEVTQKALFKKVKKIAPVTKVELKEEPKTNKKYGVVQLEKVKDVEIAIQKLDRHIFKGATLKAVALGAAMKEGKESDGQRLIVRNLSFQTTDSDLEKLFSECGALVEALVVRLALEDPDNAPEGAIGKSRGFGFVQFRDGADARKSIEKLNGFKLKGREMIVDFALSKAKYLQQQKEAELQTPSATSNIESDDVAKGEDDDDDDVDLGDNDEGETLEMEDNVEDDEASDDEMEDEDDADANDSEEDIAPVQHKEDSEEQRSRTVFIRNLSFQTTEESLKEFCSEFGAVEYARVVYDKGSGLSKGVAFVRFKETAVADLVLSRGQVGTDQQQDKKSKYKKKNDKKPENMFTLSALADGDALMLDGRMLIVSRAVAKDDADRLTEVNSAERKKKDKRNMYLAYEGTISVNKISEEELELPKIDVDKRRRAIKEKKEKLKNPMYFVSPTRLSVRNLGTLVEDKQLKTLFHDAAVSGIKQLKVSRKEIKADFLPQHPLDKIPVKVKMAKIVRDMENVKPGKEPRSRGYAFVEFVEHVHALAALRVLNNNPQYTSYAAGGSGVGKSKSADSEKSRLIVEFALENHGKLKLREKKHQDAQKKRDEERALREAQGDSGDVKEKKSRGQRQRERKKHDEIAGADESGDSTQATKPDQKPKTVPQSKQQHAATKKAAGRAAAKEEQRQPKKRKRHDGKAGDIDMDLPQSGEVLQTLSRKQRKQAKELQHEQSFDALVRNYKQEIFGEKASALGSSAGQTSSAVSGSSASGGDRWFD